MIDNSKQIWNVNRISEGNGVIRFTYEIDNRYLLFRKRYFAKAFYSMKNALDYYKEIYEHNYNFDYEIIYENKKDISEELELLFSFYDGERNFYDIKLNEYTSEKLSPNEREIIKETDELIRKLKLKEIVKKKNSEIYLPKFVVTANFNSVPLSKALGYSNVSFEDFTRRIKELLTCLYKTLTINVSERTRLRLKFVENSKILDILDEKIFLIKQENKGVKESELICFFPELLEEAEIVRTDREVFNSNKEILKQYLGSKILPNIKGKDKTSILHKFLGYLNKGVFGDFSSYKVYLEDTDKSKVNIYGYVDWSNVNKAVFNNDINWKELLNYLYDEIIKKYLRENKIIFSSLEYKEILFVKYKFENNEDEADKRNKISEEDTENVTNIVNELKRSGYNAEIEDASKKSSGNEIDNLEKHKENQAVDKEILARLAALFNSIKGKNASKNVIILFSSDSDYLIGFDEESEITLKDFLRQGSLAIVVSFGLISNKYKELKEEYKNLIIIELNELIDFITYKKGK